MAEVQPMGLFQVQRYWSEDEGEPVQPDEVGPLKKRPRPDSAAPEIEAEVEAEAAAASSPPPKKKKKKSAKKKKKASASELAEAGFTVLGQDLNASQTKVQRVLPQWLAQPDIVTVDFQEDQLGIADMPGLDEDTRRNLSQAGITRFFPVQRQVIPHLLPESGQRLFRPRDVCVSAPTGSGKTLAFVVPIVQAVKRRVVPGPRALVVLPVQELAAQVAQVFHAFTAGTNLRVKLLTPQRPFEQEQQDLVRRQPQPVQMADILITTPGRLVDHLLFTHALDWAQLRYLVIDEADRVMEAIHHDWLGLLEGRLQRPAAYPMTVATLRAAPIPLQKLLFSATLSQNPEQLQTLNLFEPRLFTSVVESPSSGPAALAQGFEFVGQYTTPAELQESLVVVQDPLKKPMILQHLLRTRPMAKAIVFTNTIEHAHFLAALLQEYDLRVGEMSSQNSDKRGRILNQLKSGKINILVSTDAMARGMDIGDVDLVVSYDAPKFIKTYIHRVGRTARAGVAGHALTLVEAGKGERKLRNILKEANKESVVTDTVDEAALDEDEYKRASEKAAEVLKEEKAQNPARGKFRRKVKGKSSQAPKS
eukprot:maker-scaffold385_size188773-snap-gene-0.26 protein:Tk10813 transcript:maker-scaffold385_size188773-snap-gene-0.26-mRNA-1 annotation:"dead box atp-dependent rna"